MRCLACVFLFFLLCSISGFSQEKFTNHTVKKGETISSIAKKYHIEVKAIYQLNPDAVNGLKWKSILLIPSSSKNKTGTSQEIISSSPIKIHEVLPKETIYGIAKKYHKSIAELYKMNPDLEKEGIKIGQKINILLSPIHPYTAVETSKKEESKEIETPKTASIIEIKKQEVEKPKENPVVETKIITENTTEPVEIIYTTDEGIVYEVLPKETKYSIAKRYGISIDRLDKVNPILQTEELKIGQKIIIPVKPYNPNGDLVIKRVETAKPVGDEAENTEIIEYKHEVLAKETKYGIAKEYGLTVRELESQNPKIVKRLTLGTTLTIRSTKVLKEDSLNEVVVAEERKEEPSTSNSVRDANFLERLIETASENIGVRYRSGGKSKEGFDCSGLMCVTFENNNIQLPRTSVEQSQLGVVVAKEDAKKGDLIFFKTNRRSQINHVGMVVEVADGDIKFIHASSSGVRISSLNENYYEKRFAQINHVL